MLAALLTIPHLQRQADEARRQADFTVGNTAPTAALFDIREVNGHTSKANRLEVVNWNRHPIIIHEVKLSEPLLGMILVNVVDHDTARADRLNREYERRRLVLPGWIDRSRPPTVVEIDVYIQLPQVPTTKSYRPDRRPVAIAVNLSITGDETQLVSCHASRGDGRVQVPTDEPDPWEEQLRQLA